jgi:hypothetical protein
MLKKEISLTPQRILQLQSPEEICAFFAELGYRTDLGSEPQVDSALGQTLHTHGETRNKIRTFSRIAEHSDETLTTLYVYLYVLNSLTARTRQDIARDLQRLHKGDFLCILTSPTYNDLEFVFLDPVLSTTSTSTQPAMQQTLFDPQPQRVGNTRVRVFSVDRRHPSRVALRFLRGLRATRHGVWEQCKAISRAYDTAETSEEFFNNRSLFSDYYLNERLPKDVPEWLKTEGAGGEKDEFEGAYGQLRRLYAGAAATYGEAPLSELRAGLFEPVLDTLGFDVKAGRVSRKQSSGASKSRPDYRFEIANYDGSTTRVICKLYPWGRVLDDYLESDEEDEEARLRAMTTSENPAAVIVSLLEQEQAQWALLSNGKTWRLYSPKARSRSTNYYEIDLQEILTIRRQDANEALRAFRYFWLFFRAASFGAAPRPDQETPPYLCLLDYLMRESEQYARELGDSLKERVFDDIFPFFAQGFVSYAQATGRLPADMGSLSAEERAALLKPYFECTLTFLYRLLVLFYAESRALLPVYDERYHASSLTKLKEELRQVAGDYKADARKRIEARYSDDHNATGLYRRLEKLFRAIDQGDDELNVPAYNGGLFLTGIDKEKQQQRWTPDEQVAAFLLTHAIPDRYLALGLDLMARDEEKKRTSKAENTLVFVDYKSLGVRQLGSIYEGLLEFKLRMAVEDMVEIKNRILPKREAIAAGQYKEGRTRTRCTANHVYIENDRHERKITGSYYTPDYVVQYIIEQTVGPILQDKFQRLSGRFRDFQRELENKQRGDKQRQQMGMLPDGIKKLYDKYQDLTEEFFDIKVLDPAMGSGHFLVNAADYITDRMTEFLDQFKPNPVQFGLQQIRSAILQEVERQHVSIDRSRLTELNLLKRQVLKRCIFGVDVNHMAVTLTKVSLWLDTFTQGAPFSFLDYHLKWGNSLLGVNLDTVLKEAEGRIYTIDLADVLRGVHLAHLLSLSADSTSGEVKASQELYDEMLAGLQPYKKLMNVWVSEYFGNKQAQETVEVCAEPIIKQQDASIPAFNQAIIERAQAIAAPAGAEQAPGKNFFHWDLEFPEVFFNEQGRKPEGQAGFDAVIGNPPYGKITETETRRFVNENYHVTKLAVDTFALFINKAAQLMKTGGEFGFIIPSGWLTSPQHEPLRRYLLKSIAFQFIIHLPYDVFPDAYVDTIIGVGKKIANYEEHNEEIITRTNIKRLGIHDNAEQIFATEMNYQAIDTSRWTQDASKRMITEVSEAKTMIQQKIKSISAEGSELLRVDRGITPIIPVTDYSSANTAQAFNGDFERYFFSDSAIVIRYDKTLAEYTPPNFFQEEGIIIRRIISRQQRIIVALNDRGYVFNKSYLIALCLPQTGYSLYYVLAIIASRLQSRLFIWSSEIAKRDDFPQLDIQTVRHMLIRRINFVTPEEQRAQYREKARLLYQQCLSENKYDCVLGFVEHHLARQPEASDIVHDLLAFLAEEMIRLNREKREEQRAFLNWLAERLKIQPQPDKTSGKSGIEALQGKARLLDYPGDYQKGEKELQWAELKAILLTNKKRLGLYPGDAILASIEERYQQSLAKTLPLKQQLAQTDALIDQVVYRLYGLTPEERDIVEGRA